VLDNNNNRVQNQLVKDVFVIVKEEYDPLKGYCLCTVTAGIRGYQRTTLYCGHDATLASIEAMQRNRIRGISDVEAKQIIYEWF